MPSLAIVAGLLFVIVYLKPILYIFRNPYSYHFSHGLLILGIIFYMVWQKRESLQKIAVSPCIIPGAIVLLLGSALLWAGKYTETPVVEGTALIIGVAGIILLLFGAGFLKALLFPIFFLNFLFPIFDKILANYSPYFERTAALIGGQFLKIIGMPVFQNGQFLELPHIVLKVGQACNGINHIIALMALVIFWGYLRNLSLFNMMLSIFIAAAAGILANGLRVGLIGVWTKYYGTESFHGPFDIFYSTFVFLAGVIFLMAVLPMLQKKESPQKIHQPDVNSARRDDKDFINKRITFASGSALAVLLPTLSALLFVHPSIVAVDMNLTDFPRTIAGWQGEDVDRLGEPFDQAADYDSVLRRVYRDQNGNSINLFMGYMSEQQRGREIYNGPRSVELENAAEMRVSGGTSGPINLKTAGYYVGKVTKKAIYFYCIDGKIIGSRYMAKIYSLLHGIMYQKTNAAVIVASFSTVEGSPAFSDEAASHNFVGELIPAVQAYLRGAGTERRAPIALDSKER